MNSFLIPSICIFSLFLATAGWGAAIVSLGSKGVPWAAPSHWGQLQAVFISGQNASADVTSDSYHKQLGFRLWSLTSKATRGNTRLSGIISNARCFKKRGSSLSLSLQSRLAHKVKTGLQGPACVVLSLSAIFHLAAFPFLGYLAVSIAGLFAHTPHTGGFLGIAALFQSSYPHLHLATNITLRTAFVGDLLWLDPRSHGSHLTKWRLQTITYYPAWASLCSSIKKGFMIL